MRGDTKTLKNIIADNQYMNIVEDIYYNAEFNKIKTIEHHGVTRFEHSLRVSYYSYKLAKLLKLDYISVARAGLLHDFFFSKEDRSKKDRFISVFIHPKISILNSLINFKLNEKEKDIIITHMFPINFKIPKYVESWIVSFVDKGVAIYEFYRKFKYSFKFKYATNIYILFLINFFN